MKFDTIIIGGGLAGLVSGIRLQENGHNCAIVSTGQSALHFSSGSFDLLGCLPDGTEVMNPLDAIGSLESSHPYRLVGLDAIKRYDKEFPAMMQRASITLTGSASRNSYHFTPMGTMKRTWLTLEDFVTLDEPSHLPWHRVAVINFPGFLDFYTKFIADELEKQGATCVLATVKLPFIEKLRTNPTEMRSANIARTFDKTENIDMLLREIASYCKDVDAVVMPAVFGLSSAEPMKYLKQHLDKPLCPLATMPPSVPGIRMQQQLTHYFVRLGGTFMLGDTVERADVESGLVKAVYTANHADIPLMADHFILATGSFFSRGIIARPDSVYEPIFDLDVLYDADRTQWYDNDMFASQNYMKYGVITAPDFRAICKGETLSNLYAVGSVLSGHDALHEGCGGGVSIMSSMYVADSLLKNK